MYYCTTTTQNKKKKNQHQALQGSLYTVSKNPENANIESRRPLADCLSTTHTLHGHHGWNGTLAKKLARFFRDQIMVQQLTTESTSSTDALGISGKPSGVARDDACATAVCSDCSLSRSSTSRRRLLALRRRGFAVLGRSSFAALSRRGIFSSIAAGNGSSFASPVLLDSERLKHGLGLFSCRIDGEDHALSTMALLTAVEPCKIALAIYLYKSK